MESNCQFEKRNRKIVNLRIKMIDNTYKNVYNIENFYILFFRGWCAHEFLLRKRSFIRQTLSYNG